MITVTDAALQQVVVGAAEGVEGARVRRARRHLEIAVDGSRVRVELDVTARYGEVLPALAREVQERVADALAQSCGLQPEAIDVTVAELEGA
jgi:uncharacterized alkaline shock family protein YloU